MSDREGSRVRESLVRTSTGIVEEVVPEQSFEDLMLTEQIQMDEEWYEHVDSAIDSRFSILSHVGDETGLMLYSNYRKVVRFPT